MVDVHCGGGRWLIAMARRFPALELVGVEFEPDSVARARANIAAAGLTDRITIREAGVTEPGRSASTTSPTSSTRSTSSSDAPAVLGAAWPALRPGGRLLVLDWPLPVGARRVPDPARRAHRRDPARRAVPGHGAATRDQFLAWFAEAGLPTPTAIDLPSGAVGRHRRTRLRPRVCPAAGTRAMVGR